MWTGLSSSVEASRKNRPTPLGPRVAGRKGLPTLVGGVATASPTRQRAPDHSLNTTLCRSVSNNQVKAKNLPESSHKGYFLDRSNPIANPLGICLQSCRFTECTTAGKPEKRIFLLQNATTTGSVLMQNA
jgi:hypothetical protein